MTMVRLGRFLFRYRGAVFTAIGLGVLIVSTPRYLLGRADLDAWMDVVGALVALAGLAVRALTIGYEYIVRGGRRREVYADYLVQGGIYAHTRNPMYLGNLLMMFGWALIVNAPEFYLIALPLACFFYAAIIATEEAYLRTKFGEGFDEYCAKVNRILPRLSGFRGSIDGMRFNWQRVFAKDYSTMFLSVLLLGGLAFWDDFTIQGNAALPRLTPVLMFVTPWLGLYFVVWRLKKTRRLDERHASGSVSP